MRQPPSRLHQCRWYARLKGHWGRQELTPTPSGGTRLDYTIGFDSSIPGLAALVGKVLASAISTGLPKLTD